MCDRLLHVVDVHRRRWRPMFRQARQRYALTVVCVCACLFVGFCFVLFFFKKYFSIVFFFLFSAVCLSQCSAVNNVGAPNSDIFVVENLACTPTGRCVYNAETNIAKCDSMCPTQSCANPLTTCNAGAGCVPVCADADQSVCTVLSASANANIINNGYCDDDMQMVVCKPKLADGAECTEHFQCRGFCEANGVGTCKVCAPGLVGHTCTADWQCQSQRCGATYDPNSEPRQSTVCLGNDDDLCEGANSQTPIVVNVGCPSLRCKLDGGFTGVGKCDALCPDPIPPATSCKSNNRNHVKTGFEQFINTINMMIGGIVGTCGLYNVGCEDNCPAVDNSLCSTVDAATPGNGYCSDDGCVSLGVAGDVCDLDTQCISRMCEASDDGSSRCCDSRCGNGPCHLCNDDGTCWNAVDVPCPGDSSKYCAGNYDFQCEPRLVIGEGCNDDDQCLSGTCGSSSMICEDAAGPCVRPNADNLDQVGCLTSERCLDGLCDSACTAQGDLSSHAGFV